MLALVYLGPNPNQQGVASLAYLVNMSRVSKHAWVRLSGLLSHVGDPSQVGVKLSGPLSYKLDHGPTEVKLSGPPSWGLDFEFKTSL